MAKAKCFLHIIYNYQALLFDASSHDRDDLGRSYSSNIHGLRMGMDNQKTFEMLPIKVQPKLRLVDNRCGDALVLAPGSNGRLNNCLVSGIACTKGAAQHVADAAPLERPLSPQASFHLTFWPTNQKLLATKP